MAWGSGWILLVIVVLIFGLLFFWLPPRETKQQQREFVVTIEGTVQKVLDDDTDKRGGRHQRLFVRANKVVDNPNSVEIDQKRDIFVVIRYGDRDGFPRRLKALDASEGKPIEIRGNFISKDRVIGNNQHAVLHFTHKPVGYIRFENKIYR